MNQDALAIAQQALLEPAGLGGGDLDRVMGQLLGATVDAADVYLQATRYESWALEDGIVKEGSHSIDRGVGVRAVSGEKTGFAYSDDIALPALLRPRKARAPLPDTGTRAHGKSSRRNALQHCICPSIRCNRCLKRKKSPC